MPKPRGFSYAVTRGYLFVNLGGSSMLESAIQGMDGASNSIWDDPEVVEALNRLPAGESLIAYQDTRRIVVAIVELIARGSGMFGSDEDEGPSFDPDSLPSADTLAQYWGSSVSAVYVDPDGIRSVGLLQHGESDGE